jgi:hypothetical protein
MKLARRGLLVVAFMFVACSTTKKAAVSTFHVIDAPANYIRHHIDEGDQTTTTTTTTRSDVTNPGQPVPTTPPPPRRTTTSSHEVETQSSPRPSPRTSSSSTQQQTPSFPTAKPVPGKPGFVISPFDPSGGYVDVTGYPSGSKAKDPYSQKIFIVP